MRVGGRARYCGRGRLRSRAPDRTRSTIGVHFKSCNCLCRACGPAPAVAASAPPRPTPSGSPAHSSQRHHQFIEATYPTVVFKQHLLRTALKTAVGAGKLVQDKQSFKLSAAEKKPPAKPKKKVVKKKVRPSLAATHLLHPRSSLRPAAARVRR